MKWSIWFNVCFEDVGHAHSQNFILCLGTWGINWNSFACQLFMKKHSKTLSILLHQIHLFILFHHIPTRKGGDTAGIQLTPSIAPLVKSHQAQLRGIGSKDSGSVVRRLKGWWWTWVFGVLVEGAVPVIPRPVYDLRTTYIYIRQFHYKREQFLHIQESRYFRSNRRTPPHTFFTDHWAATSACFRLE